MKPRLPLTWLAAAGSVLLATQTLAAEPLGRLFLTPERRAILERQRQLNIPETQKIEGSVVSLDGIVRRSSGRNTVWVNQQPQDENSAGTGVTATISPSSPGRALVTAGDEPAAALKVGESINRGTREKTDGLGGGRVGVSRKP
jgi:hypothetical protein